MGIFNKKKKDSSSLVPKETGLTTLQPKDEAEAPLESAKPVEFKRAGVRKFLSVAEDRILRRPLITEKTMRSGSYVFVVAMSANKINVKKAFFNLYGVEPMRVNIAIQKGKVVRSGRIEGRRKDWKKAIIVLKKGDKIDTL